jgi:hypothetical protein
MYSFSKLVEIGTLKAQVMLSVQPESLFFLVIVSIS